jgi:hypothetical protein
MGSFMSIFKPFPGSFNSGNSFSGLLYLFVVLTRKLGGNGEGPLGQWGYDRRVLNPRTLRRTASGTAFQSLIIFLPFNVLSNATGLLISEDSYDVNIS